MSKPKVYCWAITIQGLTPEGRERRGSYNGVISWEGNSRFEAMMHFHTLATEKAGIDPNQAFIMFFDFEPDKL